MAIANIYELQTDFKGNARVINPENDNLVFIYTNEGGYYKLALDTELLIRKEDYIYFKAIEDSVDRCEKIPLKIYSLQPTRNLTYSGYFNLNNGNFNPFKFQLNITPSSDDAYDCIERNKKLTKNLLTAAGNVTVRTVTGAIVEAPNNPCICEDCTNTNLVTPVNGCLANASAGWTLRRHIGETLGGGGGGSNVNKQSYWIREEAATQPPGDGWQLDGTTYVRSVPVAIGTVSDQRPTRYEVTYKPISSFTPSIDNGRTLESVLLLFLNPCGLTIVSEFFSINPTGVYPNNLPYQKAVAGAQLKNIILFQISDITRFDATQNATIANLTLDELLADLQNTWPVEWWVEGTVFHIEHVTFKSESQGLDISAKVRNKGLDSYGYANEELPTSERWQLPNAVSNAFTGVAIEYDSVCTNGEEKSYNLKLFNSDLEYVVANPTKISDSGLFIIAAAEFNGNLVIPTATTVWTNETKLNGWMAIPNIHANYWTYDRPQLSGTMNGAATIFQGVKRTKKGQALTTVLSADEFRTFDPALLIKGPLGWGESDKLTYDGKSGKLEIEPLL